MAIKNTNLFLVEDDDDIGKVRDPLLNATVYFGRVGNGRDALPMCDQIASINTGEPELMYLTEDPCFYINRYITQTIFNTLLTLYENNQMIYCDSLDKPGTVAALNNLESWFIQVVEPAPTTRSKQDRDDWISRERKKMKGRTWYCDSDCAKKIRIADIIIEQVNRNWASLSVDYQIK
jgi:hypothetical protein